MVQKKEQIKTNLTLYDILKSWSKDEIEQLNIALSIAETNKVIAKEDDYDEDSEFDTNYTQFMKVLDHGTKIPAPFESVEKETKVNSKWAPIEEVASVGDYMTIQRLVPILEHLLSKHGDISAMSMLRPKVKMYLYYMLCERIYRMINSRVVDITEDLLLNWWTSLRILQFAEFNIQFAFDHLKRVVQAYLGLCVRKEVDNALDKIDRDILALEEKRKCIIAAKSKKSNLAEECLKEASILKHWKASTLFFHE
ncbi:hypothetical protein CMV_019203 [Castanea mollissima]|uniref:Uncharacterized protein n=1 Tax=Castanea mollissima TaxID=60419 RepID=A0A8J4R3G3_9ROSI|nr:hypothetical protein CMV_019203 [Castanea mollissima]